MEKCCLCGKEIKNISVCVLIDEKCLCQRCTNKIVNAVDDYETGSYISQDFLKEKPDINENNVVKRIIKSESQNTKILKKIKIEEIVKNVKDLVKGQDELIKKVVISINNNLKFPNRKGNLLIASGSGTGKTLTISTILDEMKIPYMIEDITSYSEVAYVGKNVDEIIEKFYYMFEKNKKKIESGVIVIDEFDKIKASSEQNGRDASGLGVQKSLLKLLEGKICQMKDGTQIDTSKMTFVLLGAFKELRNERDKRLNSYNIKSQISIGFIQEETEPIIKQNKSFIIEDFEKSGYMTEVIGRVRTIIEGNELGEDDFLDILKNSKLSNFNGIKEELLEYNVKLEIKQGTFEKIAQIAFEYKSGARAINKVLDEMFSNILYDILSNEDKYSKCIISPETVEDNQDYILE